MLVYADLRCLQDPGFARRGIGSHAAFLLAAARSLRRGEVTIIGLADAALGAPPAEISALCDSIQYAFAPRPGEPAVFLWLSPMTHDTRLVARFFDRPEILPCAVVYDFIPLIDPDRYLASRGPLLSYAAALEWLAAAGLFLPISTAVGDEVVTRLGVDPEAVAVTGVALRGAFAARHADGTPAPRPASAPGRYVMFVGGPDPRKNLETVVKALGRTGSPDPALVIAGGYPDRWRRRVERVNAKAEGRTPHRPVRLTFLDHVSDDELAGWYGHAEATVVASRAEGFSMPVIEAMACGSPVIASDIPCHRELVTDPAARFAPDDPDELAARLRAVMADPAAREELIASQRPTPDRFTAARVGERFAAALELRMPGHARRARKAVAARRPVIALLSPFPPDRSGVADYTRRTVAALSARADVDVWTDQPEPVADPRVRAFHGIGNAAWLRPDYDATVAVLGNSHFHAPILAGHLRHGGPCILHDSRLLDLNAWWHGIERTRALAEAELRRPVSEAEVRHWTRHQGEIPTLFLSEVARASAPLFVHSRALADHVARLYGVEAVHLPFALLREFTPRETAAASRQRARAALGIPAGRTVIVTLGIYGATKAPEVCAEAIARLRATGRDAHLVFVGDAGRTAEPVLRRAAEAGVAEAIHFTAEWIDDETWRTWLLAADGAIQLRTHRFGGISGALMDCIAAGVPTVANEDLAAALDAPATVARVPDTFTADMVAGALGSLLARGDGRDEATRVRYCNEHSMENYVACLLAALGIEGAWVPSGRSASGCRVA
jgi:glycosyltransferase involved in cell wall biosynthesis